MSRCSVDSCSLAGPMVAMIFALRFIWRLSYIYITKEHCGMDGPNKEARHLPGLLVILLLGLLGPQRYI